MFKHLDGQVSLLLHQQVIAKAVEAAFSTAKAHGSRRARITADLPRRSTLPEKQRHGYIFGELA